MRAGALIGFTALFANAGTYLFYAASARALGVENGGAILALIAAALMLSVPAGLVGFALSSVIARDIAAGRDSAARSVAGDAQLSLVAGAVAIAVASATSSGVVARFFHGMEPSAVHWAAVALVANAALLLLRGVLQGFHAFELSSITNAVEGVAKIVAAVTLLHGLADVTKAAAVFALALVVPAVFTAGLVTKSVGPRFGAGLEFLHAARSSWPLVATMSALTAMTFFDAVASRRVLSPHEAGLYNAAALAGRALMTTLAFLPAVLLPKLMGSADRRKHVSVALLLTAALCLPALALFVAMPRFIVQVVAGPSYAQASSLVPRYGLAACALAGTTVLATAAMATDARAGLPITLVAILEIVAIALYHPDASGLISVVVTGHVSALVVSILIYMRKASGARHLKANATG